MNKSAKLAELGQIAALLRDIALQDLARARRDEAELSEALAELRAAQHKARADAGADTATARQNETYMRWADIRRDSVMASHARATDACDTCRAAAQSAVGRTDVLAKLLVRRAAVARATRMRNS